MAIGLPLLAIALPQFVGTILSFALKFRFTTSIAILLYFGIICWSYVDADRRGKPGILVALLVAIALLLGLILWLIFRPPINS